MLKQTLKATTLMMTGSLGSGALCGTRKLPRTLGLLEAHAAAEPVALCAGQPACFCCGHPNGWPVFTLCCAVAFCSTSGFQVTDGSVPVVTAYIL